VADVQGARAILYTVSMMSDGPLELEFQKFVAELIRRETGRQTVCDAKLNARGIVDIIASSDSSQDVMLIETRLTTPQTGSRLMDLAIRLQAYRSAYLKRYPEAQIQVVLVISGVLAGQYSEFFETQGISVWDGCLLLELAIRNGMQEKAVRFIGPDIAGEGYGAQTRARAHLPSLQDIPPGKSNWAEYQKACLVIFEYLFCPPLERPYEESSTERGVNRRDIVIPNYSTNGFWKFVRDLYRADFVVVDAKNLSRDAGKVHLLQLANYLSTGGLGLFGMIVTRSGLDRTGKFIQREQWLLHQKMIIVLNHDDIDQMLAARLAVGESPEVLIRQKIEDFRLSI
jgi:hypothetical protein